ncbi:glycosyltransferase [Qingshengfaniella alkalisoli]|uniref:Glycosyltransferase n=1 Tax=Qingshengfaniella alkalisoli TaxID=2599296 RepID=A0A5B8IXS1_9RHOB|nr:glycosyltransferase [Qingshengfaniella alkalisoli]QDY70403.1 glycosyltransferase [Qingshengfaniella alkalisoli]
MTAAPRIALAPGSIDGGGIGTVTLNLAEGLVARGAKVDLLLTTVPKDGRRIPDGVETVVLAGRTRQAFGAAKRYMSQSRPHMIVTARNYMHLLMTAAHRSTGASKHCALVWSFHTHRSTERSHARLKDRLVDALAVRFAGWADHLVAVSHGVGNDLAAAGLPEDKLRVIENPAWTDWYNDLAQAPCFHPWLQGGEVPVILGIGRLSKQKDFPLLIRAFAKLRASHPARLIILGEGPDRSALEALISDLEISEHVSLPGHVPNVFCYLAKAQLFVLSSRWEGFGMVLVEAMGCGCPVISTDCPAGPAEILQGGRLGPLVPVGDVTAMAHAMVNTLAAQIPLSASALPMDRFRADEAAQRYLSLMVRT